jgi:hypothetical protein
MASPLRRSINASRGSRIAASQDQKGTWQMSFIEKALMVAAFLIFIYLPIEAWFKKRSEENRHLAEEIKLARELNK